MSATAFLQPSKLLIYYTDRDEPSGGDLSQEAVRDMEIQNQDALVSWVQAHMQKDPKGKVQLVIVVAEALCYMLELTGRDEEEQMKHLLSITPFANPSTAVLTVQNKRYAVATNLDLYEGLIRAFETVDHAVSAVVPYAALSAAGIAAGGVMDRHLAKRVSDSLSALKPFAFSVRMKIADTPKPEEKDGRKPEKKKISKSIIILGVVAFIYVIIMYVFFIRGQY